MCYDEMLDAASSGRLKALLLVASDPASEGPAGRRRLKSRNSWWCRTCS